MKKLFEVVLVMAVILSLCGCAPLNLFFKEEDIDGVRMVAEIVAIGDKIEVEVIDGEYGASGIYWVNVGETTVFKDADGGSIEPSDLSVGDQIEIIYSGQVMMSYPPQIMARKITLIAKNSK